MKLTIRKYSSLSLASKSANNEEKYLKQIDHFCPGTLGLKAKAKHESILLD